jgi:DNA-binding HxlR family transcriptional regulator
MPIKLCRTKHLNGREYRCYFELALQVIGGKWKQIILFHLAQEPCLRFGELKRFIPEVSERMLTRQLRELEADGLVHREVYREVPPRVEYSLTEHGCGLLPVLLKIREWGIEHERFLGGEGRFTDEGYEPLQPPVFLCRGQARH